jgi:hypothetical protein
MVLNMNQVNCKTEYIERLQSVILHLHACKSSWVESVLVTETFHGQTVWKGVVEVFDLRGHPKAKRLYGWHHREGKDGQGERFVTVLELPPVTSPETAVKVAVAGEIRQRRKTA